MAAYCRGCGQALAQGASCGRCQRDQVRSRRAYEAAAIANLRADQRAARNAAPPARPALRTATYDGRDFEVMWDGSR